MNRNFNGLNTHIFYGRLSNIIHYHLKRNHSNPKTNSSDTRRHFCDPGEVILLI